MELFQREGVEKKDETGVLQHQKQSFHIKKKKRKAVWTDQQWELKGGPDPRQQGTVDTAP